MHPASSASLWRAPLPPPRAQFDYRCNRMVMFDSKLLHKTDTFHFHPGYANRRVNLTFLYGSSMV